MEKICQHVVEMATDEYGNYALRIMLARSRLEYQRAILEAVQHNIVFFSTSKTASNVVCKCFSVMGADRHDSARLEEVRNLTHAILGEETDDDCPLNQLVGNVYGSSVLKFLVETCLDDDEELVKLKLSKITPKMNQQNRKSILNALSVRFDE